MSAGRFKTVPFWFSGVIALAIGLMGTAAIFREQLQRLDGVEQERFDQRALEVSLMLQKRLASYTEVVAGLKGLFIASADLTREQFEQVAGELGAMQRNPGLINLSFTRRVAAVKRVEFEESRRHDPMLEARGIEQFTVHPSSKRLEYFVADYVWPMKGNESILGFDIGSQPTNLLAMERSRELGETVASAPFVLLQESARSPGFVIRMPVFKSLKKNEGQSRQDRFLGAVAVTVNVTDMMRDIVIQSTERSLSMHLADVGAVDDSSGPGEPVLLYADPARSTVGQVRPALFDIPVHGRHWQLRVQSQDRFLSVPEQRAPRKTAAAGILLSLLLAATVTWLARQRGIALGEALRSERARKNSEGKFLALFNQAAVGVALVEISSGQLLEVNERFASIVGDAQAALIGRTLLQLFEPGNQEQPGARELEQAALLPGSEFIQELQLIYKNECDPDNRFFDKNEMRWVTLTISAMHPAEGSHSSHAIVVLHDITKRRDMEESLRRNGERFRSLLNHLPVGVMLMEQDGRTALCNQQFTQITGYTADDIPDSQSWWSAAYPDIAYREELQARWRTSRLEALALSSGMIAPTEFRVTCAGGQVKTLEIAGVLVESQLLITFVDLTHRKAAEEEIRALAYYDVLTELPNRRLLVTRLDAALSKCILPSHCALMLLDVDNFKTLNDTRGHHRGDALLKLVGGRLLACVRSDDTVARQGGDEFAILLESVGDSPEEAKAHCERIGEKILGVLREPYYMDGETHHSTMSIGVALFTSRDHSVEELLQHVDVAMYQAKAAGRDTLCFYDPSMHAQASERANLEDDMRAGLVLEQFELFYQPQVMHGRIVAAEALLRWHHPERGFVSPAAFIPLAEESGLILPLGQWVLEQACLCLAQWAKDPELRELSLAVNVSPRQFRQAGFVQQVLGTLATTGAAARRLKLEITEGLLLHDVDDCASRMTELKSYGVGFSLDDFGTGYSSLSYLKKLPLDQLKIDQSFVRDVLIDPNDASIVRTIIALGSSLGLQVVAEGVETLEQEEFLARHHCHAWQGYLLTPPISTDDFVKLVRLKNRS